MKNLFVFIYLFIKTSFYLEAFLNFIENPEFS